MKINRKFLYKNDADQTAISYEVSPRVFGKEIWGDLYIGKTFVGINVKNGKLDFSPLDTIINMCNEFRKEMESAVGKQEKAVKEAVQTYGLDDAGKAFAATFGISKSQKKRLKTQKAATKHAAPKAKVARKTKAK